MSDTDKHTDGESASLLARRESLFWRVHFWAAVIASPFALIAVLTGILYVFTPQIEAQLYGALEQVAPAGTLRPLDDAVVVASKAAPAGWVLQSVTPAYHVGETVKVSFAEARKKSGTQSAAGASEHDGHNHGSASSAGPAGPVVSAVSTTSSVASIPSALAASLTTSSTQPRFEGASQPIVIFVNPHSAEVVGSLASAERFSNWAKKLHSRVLQNDNWRWMIELAASGLMVMLLTGIYLWWPRGTQKALPQAGVKGRGFWKQWHSFVGVALAVMSFTILTTGLTWSKHAGDQVRALRDYIRQAPPQVPPSLKSTVQAGVARLTWQAAWEATRSQVPDVALQLTPPRGPEGTWRAASADRSQPQKRFDLVLDAYSGQPIYYSGWDEQTAFAKATAIGIPFHRGEFGWWNQALLLLFGVGILFSLVSGWAMFFKRQRTGLGGLPKLLPGAWKSASIITWATTVFLCVAMPLLALSAVLVVIAELAIHRPWRKQHLNTNS